jgi:hypothetical protein
MLFPGTDNWRAGMQEVSAAIDETHGELVTVTPASAPAVNFPSVADPSRSVTVIATFMNKAKTVIMGSEGKMGGHSLSPLVETSEPVFEFGYDVLRAMPYPLKQSYRITRLCNGAMYEITNIKPDGVSRTCVKVVQLGRPTSEDF